MKGSEPFPQSFGCVGPRTTNYENLATFHDHGKFIAEGSAAIAHGPQPESTRMGYSLSWIAVKGKPPQAVRDEFSFRLTDKREEFPESELTAVEMPSGWYVIVSNRSEQVVSDAAMQRLSSSGCELVTCFVEEHVMVSRATGWKEGQLVWSVTHDAQKGLLHLDVQGEPPAAFAAIRDRKFAEQAAGDRDCDYLFDIPVETARSVAGYRHDEDVPGLSGDVFEVLAPPNDERSFLKRLFDGWFRTPRSPTHR
jgi:hypothetical protein